MFQPDCVCTQGHHRAAPARRTTSSRPARSFTPHTWGNGIGLLANAHLTAGTVGAPFLEFPFDPPEWTTARRDFVLDRDGRGRRRRLDHAVDRPGLGCTLDEERLAATRADATDFG